MKIIEEYDKKSDSLIVFHMGQNDKENTELYDTMEEESFWVHLDEFPSAHIYFNLPKKAKKSKMRLIKMAGRLIKMDSKYSNRKNINICYTRKKNLKKGDSPGEVILKVEPGIIKL